MPSVSVIIPMYNKEEYIEHCLRSILSQTFNDYEILVVDDGSTDRSYERSLLVKDDRIFIHKLEHHGVSRARNWGIKNARSDFVAFLDADDYWDKYHLEVLVKIRRKYPQAGAYATAYYFSIGNGQIRKTKMACINKKPWEGLLDNYFKSAVYGDPPICSSSVAIPKENFEIAGFFKEDEGFGEDLDMWGRIAMLKPICFSWEGPAFYRKGVIDNACHLKKHSDVTPFEKTIAALGEERSLPFLRNYINKIELTRVFYMLEEGQIESAKRMIRYNKPMPGTRIYYLLAWLSVNTPLNLILIARYFKKRIRGF